MIKIARSTSDLWFAKGQYLVYVGYSTDNLHYLAGRYAPHGRISVLSIPEDCFEIVAETESSVEAGKYLSRNYEVLGEDEPIFLVLSE